MNELKFNVVQSIGEITANFDEFKNQVSQELEKYKSKEFTEDTKKDAKKDLAELRKKKAAVNERRIVLYKVQKIEALTINQYKNAFDHVKELKESCSV